MSEVKPNRELPKDDIPTLARYIGLNIVEARRDELWGRILRVHEDVQLLESLDLSGLEPVASFNPRWT